MRLGRLEEAKSLLLKTMPTARRALGDHDITTLRIRLNYGRALYMDADATLDDLREAVTTLQEAERTARRVLGGAYPITEVSGRGLSDARVTLRAREEASSLCEAMAAMAPPEK